MNRAASRPGGVLPAWMRIDERPCGHARLLEPARLAVDERGGEGAIQQQQDLPRQGGGRLEAGMVQLPGEPGCERRLVARADLHGRMARSAASSAVVLRKPHPFHFGCRALRASASKMAATFASVPPEAAANHPAICFRFGWSRASR